MAIVKMKHVRLIARTRDETDILREMMWLRTVDVSPLSLPSLPSGTDGFRSDVPGEAGTEWLRAGETVREAIDVLSPYATDKRPLFAKPRSLTRADFDRFESSCRRLMADAEDVLYQRTEKSSLRAEEARLEDLLRSLDVWRDVPVPLDGSLSRHTASRFAVMPAEDAETFDPEAFGEANGCAVEEVHRDSRYVYYVVISLAANEGEVRRALEPYHVARVTFRESGKTPGEAIAETENALALTRERLEEADTKLRGYASRLMLFEDAYDMISNIARIYTVRENLLCSSSVFLLDGWCPVNKVEKTREWADRFDAYVEFEDPQEGEEPPILLKNNRFAAAFEGITEMYALPTYRGMDPNFMMAPFFFLFFGMMLGDLGYGAIVTVACFVGMKWLPLKDGMKKMLRMFFYCGISTMVWGLLFGSCFGDVIPVFSETFLGRTSGFGALWFNPMDEPLTLFVVSFAVGFLHLMVGLGMRGFMLIRDGHVFDAICDVGFWMILLLGIPVFALPSLVASLPSVMGTVGLVMVIIGAGGLILTQGRDKKNPVMKLLMGVYSLYDITGYLSDILSYSRILALSLSTSVIGSVFNKLATMFGGGIVGFIVFLVIFLIGTVLNLALSLLSTYVHSSRLQFIEFFSKFYESGGVAYQPVKPESHYTEIK